MKLKIPKWVSANNVRLTSRLAKLGVKLRDVLFIDISNKNANLQESKPKYKLADLLAEMPDGMPMVEGWESIQHIGREIG